jgi:hypothetical protein
VKQQDNGLAPARWRIAALNKWPNRTSPSGHCYRAARLRSSVTTFCQLAWSPSLTEEHITPETLDAVTNPPKRVPWNKGKLTGAKPPLRPKHVWTIRTKLQVAGRIRDLAIFNLAIDSKLRGCDVVALKVEACSLCPSNSDINLLCYCQSIIDLDAKLLGGQRRTKVRVVLPDQRDGVITHDIRQAVVRRQATPPVRNRRRTASAVSLQQPVDLPHGDRRINALRR